MCRRPDRNVSQAEFGPRALFDTCSKEETNWIELDP
jgi:hypothetical protein